MSVRSTLQNPVTDLQIPRPPLGVIPRHLWIEQRKLELKRAIHEYVEVGEKLNLVHEWIDELAALK